MISNDQTIPDPLRRRAIAKAAEIIDDLAATICEAVMGENMDPTCEPLRRRVLKNALFFREYIRAGERRRSLSRGAVKRYREVKRDALEILRTGTPGGPDQVAMVCCAAALGVVPACSGAGRLDLIEELLGLLRRLRSRFGSELDDPHRPRGRYVLLGIVLCSIAACRIEGPH